MSVLEAAPSADGAHLVREEHEVDLSRPLISVLRQWPIFLLIVAVALAVGVAYVLLQPKEYEGVSKVVISRPRVSLNFDPRFVTRDDFDYRPFYTQAKHPDVEKGIQSRMKDELTPEEQAPGGLVGRMKVTIDRDDPGLVSLRITDANDQKAARLASIWAVAFADYAQHNLNPAIQAQKLVDAEMKDAADQLQQRDDAVRQFQQKTGLGLPLRDDALRVEVTGSTQSQGSPGQPAVTQTGVSTQAGTLPASSRLGTRGRDLAGRQATLAGFRNQREQLRLVLAQAKALRASGGSLDSMLPDLAQAGVVAAKGPPPGQTTTIDADQTIKLLEAKDKALGDSIDQLANEVKTNEAALNDDVAQLERLERDRDIARDAYTALAKKAEENRVALGSDWPAVQVFSLAGARAPAAPGPWLVALGTAGAVGVIVGVAAALWRDSRRRRPAL